MRPMFPAADRCDARHRGGATRREAARCHTTYQVPELPLTWPRSGFRRVGAMGDDQTNKLLPALTLGGKPVAASSPAKPGSPATVNGCFEGMTGRLRWQQRKAAHYRTADPR